VNVSNEDALSRFLLQARDYIHDHFRRAYLYGVAILIYSMTFPSLQWFAACYLLAVVLGALLEPCLDPASQRYEKTLVQGDRTPDKRVALTFDDGPGEDTAALLDVLAAERVQATFFCIGEQVERQPELARRIVAEGHLLANHSQTHQNLLFKGTETCRQEVSRGAAAIERVTGTRPAFFRPPYGFRPPWLGRQVKALGLRTVTWSLNPTDFLKSDPKAIVKVVLARLQAGSIVLLHDGRKDRNVTVEAVRLLIPALRKRGAQMVRVDEL
jgi:peptidoglycan/xylan/chitin deacetylase (PgdA/CDA1 family)